MRPRPKFLDNHGLLPVLGQLFEAMTSGVSLERTDNTQEGQKTQSTQTPSSPRPTPKQ